MNPNIADKSFQENLLQSISSNADNQELHAEHINANQNYSQIPLLQKALEENAANVQTLIKHGVLNPEHGQILMNQLAKKSFEINKFDNNFTNPATFDNFEQTILEFQKEKPDFFNSDGRYQVLNYLKNSNVSIDKDEITQISQIVEKLETAAIERYLKQKEHEKALNDENETAKRKLTANAQNSTHSVTDTKAFTREQIGKMSGAEFAKNERLIMEQLRKGLIK